MNAAARPLRPPRLVAGARVALISPAGPVTDERIAAAVKQCEYLTLDPVLGAAARQRRGYLAGSDDARWQDVTWAVTDSAIDAIWAIRGGYGTMRLLRSLDLSPLRARPKAFIGFSDNTTLHLAYARAGLVSFHAPHAGAAFPAITEETFRRVLFESEPAGELPLAGEPPRTLCGGGVEGQLCGGNLSLLAALCGTPVALRARDSILVLEDIGEPAYRIDRALTQLLLAGSLDDVAGLALGRFTVQQEAATDAAVEELFGELAHRLGVPAVLGLPIGHTEENWTLPFGMRARLDADRSTLSILEAAVT